MNLISHLVGLLACVWGAWIGFNTLGHDALGFVAIGGTFWFMVNLVLALSADGHIGLPFGRRRRE